MRARYRPATAPDKRGFDVSVATDAIAAAALIKRVSPEYAVVDLVIGEDSGLPILKQLVSANPNVRAVVLTGYASVATAVEAIKLGAIHYLTKPAHAGDIIDALYRHDGDAGVPTQPRPMSVRRMEWEHLQKVLTEHDGNVSAAARALGMHRRTLQRKLRKRPVRA